MSDFEKLVNKKRETNREVVQEAVQSREAEEVEKADYEMSLFNDVQKRLYQDVRFHQISGILSNGRIREAIGYMFSSLSDSDGDAEPSYHPPSISEEEFIQKRQTHGFTEQGYIDELMQGEIRFKAGYREHYSSDFNDSGYASYTPGYKYPYNMTIKMDAGDTILLRDTYTISSAHTGCWKEGHSQQFQGQYTSEGKRRFNELAWVKHSDIDSIIDHLATILAKELR